MMKIALVSQEYPPETAKGGIATQTYVRAHGLSAAGHQVWVISQSIDGNTHEYLDGPVQVHRIPGCDQVLPIYTDAARWLTYSMEVAATVHRIHSRVGFDLVVFPEWGGEGYIHLINQTPWNHIPSIVHIHGPMVMFGDTMNWPDKNSEFYRVGCMMEGASLRLADAASASNACSRQWCATHYDLDEAAIPVMYSGIDTKLFAPQGGEKFAHPTIIFVGSVRRNKGVDALLRAGASLIREFPELRILVLGKGDAAFMKSLEKIVNDSGMSGSVTFKGQVTRNDLPYYLSRSHFFAAPSIYEGGPGNVYLEAMSCGIPAIACSGSGIDGVVLHGQNGFMVEPGNQEQLVHAMRQLLLDPEKCEAMGKYAREFVLEHADTAVCMKRLEQFYQSVAHKCKTSKTSH